MIAETRPEITRRDSCRICGGQRLERTLDLGLSPLANSFLASPAEFAAERRYPLELYFCHDCSLLQLLHVVDPDVLFRHYLYVTGTSSTIARHNQEYAATLVDLLGLAPGDLVVEIASNDGSLLKCFQRYDVTTLGIEPARNLAATARDAGIDTVTEFFNGAIAGELRASRGPARVIAANNVLAHVDDPVDFLTGCRTLLADDGLVTIEVPYAGEFLDRLEYDTIYHEHLAYFSITALLRLCDRVGLAAVRIDHVPVHGGSIRLYLSRSAPGHSADVRAMQVREDAAGVTDVDRHHRFAEAVAQNRVALVAMLEQLSGEGRSLAAYGAPAKGNTLLNYCGIDHTLLPYTVDRNPLKVGLFTPGSHIPVQDVSALADPALRPDYLLILAWNFAEEIMREQQAYRDGGGQFILPVPAPRVV